MEPVDPAELVEVDMEGVVGFVGSAVVAGAGKAVAELDEVAGFAPGPSRLAGCRPETIAACCIVGGGSCFPGRVVLGWQVGVDGPEPPSRAVAGTVDVAMDDVVVTVLMGTIVVLVVLASVVVAAGIAAGVIVPAEGPVGVDVVIAAGVAVDVVVAVVASVVLGLAVDVAGAAEVAGAGVAGASEVAGGVVVAAVAAAFACAVLCLVERFVETAL